MKRKSNYSFKEILQTVGYLLRTKIFFSRSRLIRFPIVIRGKKYIDFGSNLTTGRYCRIEVNGNHENACLIFGDNVNIGDNVRVSCLERIRVGSNVLIGSKVLIIDNIHGDYSGANQDSPLIAPNQRELVSSPIDIGDNVWIGEGAVIQAGVTIGFGSIVAANSVVTKNISPRTIVGGIPAAPLKFFDESEQKWKRVE